MCRPLPSQPKMHQSTHKSYASKKQNPSTETKSKQCYMCEKHSPPDSCLAQGQSCSKCNKWNRVCRTRSENNIDHTYVNDCPQRPNDIICVNNVSLCEYDVYESDSNFNIDNPESNVEHDQEFNIKLGLNQKGV